MPLGLQKLKLKKLKKLKKLENLTTYPLSLKFITGNKKNVFRLSFTLRETLDSFGNSDFHFQSPQVRTQNFSKRDLQKKNNFL